MTSKEKISKIGPAGIGQLTVKLAVVLPDLKTTGSIVWQVHSQDHQTKHVC